MLSIIIPFRNENMLSFTVQRLQATVSVPHEIITIDDGSDVYVEIPNGVRNIRLQQATGVDAARHTGIVAAGYETILVIDAHMNFWDNDWSARLLAYGHNNPTHIACIVVRRLVYPPTRWLWKER